MIYGVKHTTNLGLVKMNILLLLFPYDFLCTVEFMFP